MTFPLGMAYFQSLLVFVLGIVISLLHSWKNILPFSHLSFMWQESGCLPSSVCSKFAHVLQVCWFTGVSLYIMMRWIYPRPSNSHKWRFSLGFPILKMVHIPGGDWNPGWGVDLNYAPLYFIACDLHVCWFNRFLYVCNRRHDCL